MGTSFHDIKYLTIVMCVKSVLHPPHLQLSSASLMKGIGHLLARMSEYHMERDQHQFDTNVNQIIPEAFQKFLRTLHQGRNNQWELVQEKWLDV